MSEDDSFDLGDISVGPADEVWFRYKFWEIEVGEICQNLDIGIIWLDQITPFIADVRWTTCVMLRRWDIYTSYGNMVRVSITRTEFLQKLKSLSHDILQIKTAIGDLLPQPIYEEIIPEIDASARVIGWVQPV